jgi:hypothetical protein
MRLLKFHSHEEISILHRSSEISHIYSLSVPLRRHSPSAGRDADTGGSGTINLATDVARKKRVKACHGRSPADFGALDANRGGCGSRPGSHGPFSAPSDATSGRPDPVPGSSEGLSARPAPSSGRAGGNFGRPEGNSGRSTHTFPDSSGDCAGTWETLPDVPAAFHSLPGLRFDAPEEQADCPRSGGGVVKVPAGPLDVPGRCPGPGRVVLSLRTSCRGSVRVLNF